MSDLLEDAAKGAAMGLPFGGPVGAVIGGLGGVIAHFAPSLLTDLFGSSDTAAQAAEVARAAVDVVQQVTGTSDPTEVFSKAADPAIDTQLRVQLAAIAADVRKTAAAEHAAELSAQVAMVQAQLADVANARSAHLALAAAGSRYAAGPPIVTAVVLGMFFFIAILVLHRGLDQNTMLVGAITTMAGAVVQYWVGSTSGSTAKTSQLVSMAAQASAPAGGRLVQAASAVEELATAARPFLRGRRS